MKLADGWVSAAAKLVAPSRPKVLGHAAGIYRAAEANASSLQKLAIEKRLAQIPQPHRKRIDLLAMFDPAADAVNGTWRMQKGLLSIEPTELARIYFPYQPPPEYDFRITFTVSHVGDEVVQVGYCAGHQFSFQVGGFGNTVAAISQIDGAEAKNNKTTRKKAAWLSEGGRYTSVIKVRKTGVEAYLDGELIAGLKTDYKNLSLIEYWRLPRTDVIGIGVQKAGVHFDAIEVIEITGEGKMLSHE